MTNRVAEADREAFKPYALTLADRAKAAQSAKRRKAESEREKEDFEKFNNNIQARFGPDIKVPATLVPPYRLLNRLASSPYDHIAAPEFLASAASTERRGIQQAEDVNTGKTVAIRTGKARKISSLPQWVECYCRWCTGIFMVCGNKSEVNSLAMFKYLLKVIQLAEKRNVEAAVIYDHKYRGSLIGYHQQGHTISEVLHSDLDPSLYISAQFGGLEDVDHLFEKAHDKVPKEPSKDNKRSQKDSDRGVCIYYQTGDCNRGERCPFEHILLKKTKVGRSFYDTDEKAEPSASRKSEPSRKN
ncbi:hypothetical protein Pmar_PMAR029292 [Perkinsus marinus ATCC 50983]|uniref:C3H1-type domain-containing protein n=1 Tax=Perkinsus marinus (strain ATCC 50983 / TXsc) TaxID=423536 RepID=C5KMR8_PERM5|nr:hypothetical protein Pmar_PMAR029292 [Perkinsus marinus ATCC 50983]EER14226.1 hypothetical protein Pmar_PMAR029292 [Perkinsus marinus ATCC 50983]|eukprot:XP_002782431.1 hypothetical protein Pmar_PMAR029292 [Perkinsus marinus ATCC 50983]